MGMKKIFCIVLTAVLIFSTVGAVGASAIGTGVEIMAKDVTMIKTGLYGQPLRFCDSDFKCALCIKDFKSLTVTRLPSSSDGTLMLGGRRVDEGQAIKRRSLAALVFLPSDPTVKEASFSFKIDGQSVNSETTCLLKFIDKVNGAPAVADSLKVSSYLSTAEGISLFGSVGATDPEGDEIEFIIVSYPKHGSLIFTDKASGRYRYTPTGSFTGYDGFTYVVRDCYGNYSEPANVDIKVSERMSDVVYKDMTDRAEYNAAIALCALGVMNGKVVGDDIYFCPEDSVSRAEFVAMALKAYGFTPSGKLTESFFEDGADIPCSLVGYVVAAEKSGIIDGKLEDGQLFFRPNESISVYEAASVIARIIGARSAAERISDSEIPVWAREAVSVLLEQGILDKDTDLTAKLTKAEAAEIIYTMIKPK